MKKVIIREKSFQFALDTIQVFKELINEREFVISKQLLKSGTSIGANIEESQSAESTKDFIHKLSIALKEAMEARYWILLLEKSKFTKLNLDIQLNAINEIISILIKIINTKKRSPEF